MTKIIENLRDADVSFSTLEHKVIRKVLSEQIKNATEPGFKQYIEEVINQHTEKMKNLLDTYDYEVVNLPIIIRNAAGMESKEFEEYLKKIEALSLAYNRLFGKEVASLIILGIISKFRNLRALDLHYLKLRDELESKLRYYKGRANAEMRSLYYTESAIKEMERGILKFFRKEKIAKAKIKIRKIKNRAKNFDFKASKFSSLLDDIQRIMGE